MGNFESLQKIIQYRYRNIDILRGLIMVLMAKGHCYSTIYQTHFTESFNGDLPNYGSMAVFLTRWVGNICAPGFALLMGMSVAIFNSKRSNNIDNHSIKSIIIKRGLVLIILQQLLNLPSLLFKTSNLDNMQVFRGGVLYALGAAMIILALLLNWNKQKLLFLGLFTIVMNYLIANYILIHPSNNTAIHLLFTPGINKWVSVNYPLLPWLGIAIIGMSLGRYYINDKIKFINQSWKVALTLMLIFILLRFLNWGDYNHNVDTSSLINFLAIIKYPPSVAFVVITFSILGGLFWFISKYEKITILQPLLVFGKVPLFFYFAHYYLYIIISKFTNHVISLSAMYLLWILGLIILYPICKYYGQFKKQQSENSFWRYL
jgi:uncharacterized membrane protein